MSRVTATTPEARATLRLGLSEQEAAARQVRGRTNNAAASSSRSYSEILRSNIFNPIHNLLFGLGIALMLLGLPGDALVTVGVVAFNVVVGVVQEIRAKRQLDQIALLSRPTARVTRDGRKRELRPDAVVVGDLLTVGAGDQIVVDGVLVGSGELTVDESLLTGEADPVRKRTGDSVVAGSFVVTGSAQIEATHVGAESTAGRQGWTRARTTPNRPGSYAAA